MIHPSDRWQFISELADKGYFEDEVVQHHLTDTRAFRRSFSDKFCSDEKAVEAVRTQMRLSARCRSTLLPIVYALETVKGRLTIVMELVEGMLVRDHIGRRALSKTRAWCAFTLTLVEEMLEARNAGARFEYISLDQLILLDSGEVRFTQRHPAGRLTREQAESSPFLQRLSLLDKGGVYTSKAPPNERDELDALRDILVKAAASNHRTTYEQLRSDVLKNPSMYPTPLAGIEGGIADMLVRMTANSGSPRPVHSLAELHDALLQLRDEAAESPFRNMGTATPPPPPPAAESTASASATGSGFRPPIAAPGAARDAGKSQDSLYKFDPAPAPQPNPATATAKSNIPTRAPRTTAVHLPPVSGADMRRPTVVAPDEDLNPYASDEEKAAPSQSTSGLPRVSMDAVRSMRRSARRLPIVPFLQIFAVVLVLGGLLAGGILLVRPYFQTPAPNAPPVAVLRPPAQPSYEINAPVTFDGSDSHDEDDDPLRFQWEVISPPTANVVLTDPQINQSRSGLTMQTRGPRIVMQFQSLGEHVVELRVFDGQRFSEPVQTQVIITPRTR